MFHGLQQLIRIRKENKAFSDGELEVFDSGNQHVLSFVRSSGAERVLVLAKFSEKQQVLPSNLLRLYGLSYRFENLISEQIIGLQEIELEPYAVLLLVSRI
jgi:amylosucrase